MAKQDKKLALKIIIEAAKEYKNKLLNQHFMIIYKERGNYKYTYVGFRDLNFLHLTGVTTGLSAQQFFAACIDRKLSERDFEVDGQGKVRQKLTVLPYLSELLYNSCMIGDFIHSGIYIKADYFVGDGKKSISLGFRKCNKKDYPVTLYSEDVRKLSNPTNKVIAIFKKQYDEKYYMDCTYLSKGQDIQELLSQDIIKEKIFCNIAENSEE